MNLYSLSCIFPVLDIEDTANYYVEKLGFREVKFLDSAEPHICLYRDETEIILTQSAGHPVVPNRKLYGYGYDAYFHTDSQQGLQDEFSSKGVTVVRPLMDTDYNNREFVIEDIDGRWIAFGKKTN